MRCVAGVGLLALVGCNQLFSLAPTREFDAAIPEDVIADMPHVALTFQVASVLPSGAAPDPTIAFAPLDPTPLLRTALLDKALATASYTKIDGSIPIPRDYLDHAWRLEYTIVDGISAPVPHEIQWLPEDKLGHLTVPLFGRLARDPAPSMAGYRIKPNGVSSYSSPTMLTTGLWTVCAPHPEAGDPSIVRFDYDDAKSLSGKKGGPDPTRGDRAFLLDYIIGTSGVERDCRIAVGSVMLDSPVPTTAMAVQTPTTSWDSGRSVVATPTIDLPHIGRLQNKLGKLHVSVTGSVSYGVAPSTSMPGLTLTSPSLPLPVPLMATLVQCPYSPNPADMHPGNPLPAVAQPAGLGGFPRILHIQLVDARTVLGATLSSGMESVMAASDKGDFTLIFPAAIPTRMTLKTPSRTVLDLAGDSEQLDAGAIGTDQDPPFQLDFIPEVDPVLGVRADYHDVVLHRIVGATLTTDRIYTVTAPTVRIDRSVLPPGALYVLEIRTYKGHASAARGDFAPIDYPYGAAIVFTRTFKTS